LAELQGRNQEMLIFKEFSSGLQASYQLEDAIHLITKFSSLLFSNSAGSIYLLNQQHMLEVAGSWGNETASKNLFIEEDCMALRKGYLYMYNPDDEVIVCKHKQNDSQLYVCVPLYSQNAVLGLLHIQLSGKFISIDYATNLKMKAQSLGDQIALAITNIMLHEKLKYQSIRDPLTNLYNRRYLEETLSREINRAARKNLMLGVLMIDIDHFKYYNDMHGHDAGDNILKEVGSLIKADVRKSDIVCRYGGEEFVVVLLDTTATFYEEYAEKLREKIKAMSIKKNKSVMRTITISIGIAHYPAHGSSAEELIKAADMALYAAKNSGRNKVVVYSR
jgi:diguanylate cyclase (GGDEF)-like protein